MPGFFVSDVASILNEEGQPETLRCSGLVFDEVLFFGVT